MIWLPLTSPGLLTVPPHSSLKSPQQPIAFCPRSPGLSTYDRHQAGVRPWRLAAGDCSLPVLHFADLAPGDEFDVILLK